MYMFQAEVGSALVQSDVVIGITTSVEFDPILFVKAKAVYDYVEETKKRLQRSHDSVAGTSTDTCLRL